MSLSSKLCHLIWQQKWLPQSLGRLAYKRMAKAGSAPDHAFSKDFYGLTYQGNLSNNIDFNIYYYGAFEKPLLHFLRDTMASLAPRQATFIDIGANVGQHSLFMAAHGCHVHSFEPFDKVRERLQLQIATNRLKDVHVHPVGLSNENAKLPFFAPTGRNVGIGSFDASTTSKGNVSIGELQLVRGDDYFKTQKIEYMDLMKIDVEGFEKLALDGLRETLQSARPILVCEITYGKELSFKSVEELLAYLPSNYTLLTFDKRKEDGSKARRRDAKGRYTGEYVIVPYRGLLDSGQDDVIACPNEKLASLPRVNTHRG
ncbi:MAG: FkbM family methyltransferase [Gammaproteobacteria bacterium]|nr:FkbM family methyltransferase [Gammaproteobacteria bacterium]MDP2348980.1 FkbM family methyltransferase [Gammaproteobacteria bacterium]